MKYRKKPVTIDAFQFDGTVECLNQHVNASDLGKFGYATHDEYGNLEYYYFDRSVDSEKLRWNSKFVIKTLEGLHKLSTDDYVIKGVHGEYYPCKPDIFEETYEQTNDKKLVRLSDSDWESITCVMLNESDKLEEVKNINADNLAKFMRDKVHSIDNQLKTQDKEWLK